MPTMGEAIEGQRRLLALLPTAAVAAERMSLAVAAYNKACITIGKPKR